jgi:predicted TIM-barrel fold metal-dependent hydrolase
MIIDCHVHVCATIPGHGSVSPRLTRSLPFRFMRWRLALPPGNGPDVERAVERKLVETVAATERIDKAVVLAFDGVYDDKGNLDAGNTHLHVTNDYAWEVANRAPKLLFGASIHPYRKDAVRELERFIGRGAVLLKWLPIVQNFNPADERCTPLYEALAHHGVPLLCHTGGERALPILNMAFADPELLIPALRRGVTVIAAHCGTRSHPGEADFLPAFLRMAHEYENLFGDTAALNLPTRSYAYEALLKDEAVRRKLVHGSDWPIISVPTGKYLGWSRAASLMWSEKNWLRRDVQIKQELGFDEAYWHRAASLLRLSK